MAGEVYRLSEASNCDRNDVIVRSNEAVIAETKELRMVTKALFEALVELGGIVRMLQAVLKENTAEVKAGTTRIADTSTILAAKMEESTPALDKLRTILELQRDESHE